MDLDGDGRWETLRVKQRQPAPTWRGQDRRKGPRFVVSVHTERDAKEVKVYEADIYGWSQGWAQISVKVATKTSVALLFWSVPEEHETRVSYVHMSGAGKVHLETFKRVPLRVVDLWGDGSEALVTLSQELFQDYFKTGTMQLLRWRKGDTPGFAPVFAKAPFEFCLSLAAPSQVRVLAVDADQRALRLMRASSKTAGALDELDKVAVEPAKSGPPYQVPTGFALSCAPSQRRVQFARHHFAVTERKLRRLPQAKSH